MNKAWTFHEFFAGGGLARIGLGRNWSCVFANEISAKKASAYRLNFGPSPELRVDDIRNVQVDELPRGATLAWASFPCQDLSLAGKGTGLEGERSGTFWAFWRLIAGLERTGRKVPIVAIENVLGLITANEGKDFDRLIRAVIETGYKIGALVIDAAHFVPQSRPRLFLVAVAQGIDVPEELTQAEPGDPWHVARLRRAIAESPESVQSNWIWWKLPIPLPCRESLTEIISETPEAARWHTPEETARILGMMSGTNLEKVRKAQAYGKRIAGTIYKRIRVDPEGNKLQRAEVRFDQVSGCLRTPAGGSSRQFVIVVEGARVRTRLLDTREAARLMGVADSYVLPERYNDAYHVMGDGLAVPAVKWLEEHLLSPLAGQVCAQARKAA